MSASAKWTTETTVVGRRVTITVRSSNGASAVIEAAVGDVDTLGEIVQALCEHVACEDAVASAILDTARDLSGRGIGGPRGAG
jgi:hypothetical protein